MREDLNQFSCLETELHVQQSFETTRTYPKIPGSTAPLSPPTITKKPTKYYKVIKLVGNTELNIGQSITRKALNKRIAIGVVVVIT